MHLEFLDGVDRLSDVKGESEGIVVVGAIHVITVEFRTRTVRAGGIAMNVRPVIAGRAGIHTRNQRSQFHETAAVQRQFDYLRLFDHVSEGSVLSVDDGSLAGYRQRFA